MYYNCHFNLYNGVKVMLKSQEKLVHFLFSEDGNITFVSQPQALSLYPVLRKYKQYVQSYYNARVLAPADKYTFPP